MIDWNMAKWGKTGNIYENMFTFLIYKNILEINKK